MKTMRVLITCEKSGIVRRSFSARGHDTWSMEWIARTMRSDERRAAIADQWGGYALAHIGS